MEAVSGSVGCIGSTYKLPQNEDPKSMGSTGKSIIDRLTISFLINRCMISTHDSIINQPIYYISMWAGPHFLWDVSGLHKTTPVHSTKHHIYHSANVCLTGAKMFPTIQGTYHDEDMCIYFYFQSSVYRCMDTI